MDVALGKEKRGRGGEDCLIRAFVKTSPDVWEQRTATRTPFPLDQTQTRISARGYHTRTVVALTILCVFCVLGSEVCVCRGFGRHPVKTG